MATRNTISIEKINNAIDTINIYLSSNTSKVIHSSGINYLLKDIYNNIFNYIFLPALSEYSDDIKFYFKYITILLYQPPKLPNGLSDYDTTYYFTYYYLKLSLIYFKSLLNEFKINRTLSSISIEQQLIIQIGVHIIFEVIYNNYRHDNVETYIDYMTKPTKEYDFWKNIICGYLIENLIGLYTKNSFIVTHINGGPDLIDIENPTRPKFFEIKSSLEGNYGCNNYFSKNKTDTSRLYDCISIEKIIRSEDDRKLLFHIQINRFENNESKSYISDNINVMEINAKTLTECINTCNIHLNSLFTNHIAFKGRRLRIDLSGIQIKTTHDGKKLSYNQIFLNNICSHTWLMKTKNIHTIKRKNRISYGEIGNTGSLPIISTENIRTDEQSKILFKPQTTDSSPMIFNINSIVPIGIPIDYPNYNESGIYELPASSVVTPTGPVEQLTREVSNVVINLPPKNPPAQPIKTEQYINPLILQNSHNSQNLFLRFHHYSQFIANILYPNNSYMQKDLIENILKIIPYDNAFSDQVLLHIIKQLILLNLRREMVFPNDIIYIIMVLIQIIKKQTITIYPHLYKTSIEIISHFNPDLKIEPYVQDNKMVININGNIFILYYL